MASSINASTSGAGGVITTADNTGILNLQTAGTNAVTVDASQNVGIGTTSPAVKLDIHTNYAGDTSLNLYNEYSSAAYASNVNLIATNTSGSYYNAINSKNSAGTVTWSIDGAGSANTLAFKTGSSGTERMRIDSSGNTILGSNTSTTAYNKLNLWSPASTLNGIFMEKQSQVVVQMGFKANTNTDFFIGTGSYTLGTYGVYLANTGTSWISVSDERQKDIIEPIENALTKVNTLRTVIGKYKHDEEGVRRSFLIAQDVQAVFPEAVKTQNDEEALLGLSYTDVIPLLVAAIKEQQTIINDLKARVTALEAK
jgi:hypothetical protein